MKNTTLQICNEVIHPGESLSLALPLPELFSCAPLYMPIKVIHGKQAGPCLLITAAMHGNEINGTEIVNQLLTTKALKLLHGTLIAVPVLNVYGLINRSRDLPGKVDLNRCFPGSENGTHAARVAYLFIRDVFSKADFCIDLQTGFINYSNLPQIYLDIYDEKAKLLAEAFNAPVISNLVCEKGMLATVAKERNTPFLMYEAGEAMRFDNEAIKVGVKGILNVMKKLEMLPVKASTKPAAFKSYFTEKNIWVRASTSGINHSNLTLGQYVKQGETLGVIKDPFGATESGIITSPEDAVVVGKNNLPLVHEGEALFQLAVFPKMEQTATKLEAWKEHSEEQLNVDSGTN